MHDGVAHVLHEAVVVHVREPRVREHLGAELEVVVRRGGYALVVVRAHGRDGQARRHGGVAHEPGGGLAVEREGDGRAHGRVAHELARHIEADVVHIERIVPARLGVAAVAEVAGGGGVVGDEVYVAVLKGGDDALRAGVLLEVDALHGQAGPVAGEGLDIVGPLDVHIGPRAHGAAVAGGAVLHDRDGQQVREQAVGLGRGDVEGARVRGARAVHRREAAGIAARAAREGDGIGDVVGRELAAVVHLDVLFDGEGPVGPVRADLVVVLDDAAREVEVVVELEDVVEDELAHEQVRRIARGVGVEALGARIVEREDGVRRLGHAQLLAREPGAARGGLGQLGLGRAAGGEAEQGERRERERD